MWTPRRMLLLLAGLAGFVAAYTGYSYVLGWIDGLPQIPQSYLPREDASKDAPRPPQRDVSPTIQRIEDAFGPQCVEKGNAYPTKLEFRDSGTVIAAGPFPAPKGENVIVLAPFSLATFGKPRPLGQRAPDEAVEINTFHADRATLEFDRAISTPQDMTKARLVRLELSTDPDSLLDDPRKGFVFITNNQRSADTNKTLVVKTPGPVYYRDPKGATPEQLAGPDVWTGAAVEVVDRSNLPRGYAAASPATVPSRGDDLRDSAAVADILVGKRLPPPTVTAVGMRIYLEPDPPPLKPGEAPKKSAVKPGTARRVELLEKVLVNLWVDAKQSLVSDPNRPPETEPKPAEKKGGGGGNPLAAPEPPPAAAAVGGTLMIAAQTARQFEKALMQVETRGAFAYDVAAAVARFDVAPKSAPNVPNDVQVTRVPARGGHHKLFSQVLEIEFEQPPPPPADKPGTPPAAPAPAAPGGLPTAPGAPLPPKAGESGPTFKRMHAWVTDPGRVLTVASEDDQLEAYGNDLVFEQAANRTTLRGVPVYAVRERSQLTAGTVAAPGLLVMEPGPDKRNVTTVRGPGRVDLYDAGTDSRTTSASWRTSMTHAKDLFNRQEFDLFTFVDDAVFEDKRADYRLQGRTLKLWMEPGEKAGGKPGEKGQPVPARLQALDDVTGHSADAVIERAERFTVMFSTPKVAPKPAAGGPPAAALAGGPQLMPPPPGSLDRLPPDGPKPPAAVILPPKNGDAPPPAAVAQEPPPKPKPPMHLKARVIDAWVARLPADPVPVAAGGPAPPRPAANAPGGGGIKYEMEKARCEGDVIVHQDPAEPEKNPRGTDILGQTVIMDRAPEGSVLTVIGTETALGEVHQEGRSILGPEVVINQLQNLTTVKGRGTLQMPATSDLNGTALAEPKDMVIHWRDAMAFTGAIGVAEFFGNVQAHQEESWVACHRMKVKLDRPVYFNQARKPAAPPPPKGQKPPDDSPKIQNVYCYPVEDEARTDEARGRPVSALDVARDPKGKLLKTQWLEAREMEVHAKDRNGEKQSKVTAYGPGQVRIWQLGQKDDPAAAGPQPAKPAEKKDKPADKDAAKDGEMKLTVVTFGSRMTAEEKGKVYQEAEFFDNIQVIHLPAPDPNIKVERHRLPPGAVVLTCATRMTVATHRPANGPTTQTMRAEGEAYIRTDEYEGWGAVVTYDGPFITLHGTPTAPAQIRHRYRATANAGETIRYDRQAGTYDVLNSSGGELVPPPKKATTPAPTPPPAGGSAAPLPQPRTRP